jgi:hypothetical protein
MLYVYNIPADFVDALSKDMDERMRQFKSSR